MRLDDALEQLSIARVVTSRRETFEIAPGRGPTQLVCEGLIFQQAAVENPLALPVIRRK